MKRLWFVLLICCFCPLLASAGFKLLNLNNYGDCTSVSTISDNKFKKVEISDMILHNNGKSYECKSLKTVHSGNLTIHATFKRMTVFKNCFLTFVLNGKKYRIDIIHKSIRTDNGSIFHDKTGSVFSKDQLKQLEELKNLKKLRGLEQLKDLKDLKALSSLKNLDPDEIQETIDELYQKGIISKHTQLVIGGRSYSPGKEIVPDSGYESSIIEAP